MKVLHLLVAGHVGGIETLMKQYALSSRHENIFMFFWGGGTIADEMRQYGISTIEYNIKEENVIRILGKVISFCRKEHIDAAVSHHSAPFLKIVLSAIKILCPKTLCLAYAHANAKDICVIKKRKGRSVRIFIHKMGFALADGVIAISESVKESLEEYLGVKADKISVIYNGVPIKTYCCQQKEHKENNLIYVGRLTEEKGVHWTIQMLNDLKTKCVFDFKIVGDGAYRDVLEEMVKAYGLEDRIHFLGTRRDVPSLLSQADYFIHMPGWEEGFGITIVEAMAMGLVCICGKKGAIPEIITDGENGFLVDMQSTNQAEEQLLQVFEEAVHNDYYFEIRKKATARAEEFSIERFSLQLDSLIEEKKV